MSESNNRGRTPHGAYSTSAFKPQSALKHESTSKLRYPLKPRSATKCESGSKPLSASKLHGASKSGSCTKPQSISKPYSSSKSRTSKHNSTVATSNSSFSMSGIGPLESNDESSFPNCVPTIKRSIITKPSVNQDRDLEVKLAYNEYLQANFQKLLLEEALTRQRQDFDEQIFLQSEKNYKRKVELIQTKQQLNELELLEKVGTILQQLLITEEKFTEICQNSNLEHLLLKLITILNKMNNRVYTNEVSLIRTEESYEQLSLLMSKSALACKESTPSNFMEVNNLAVIIKSLQESVDNFQKTQNMFDATHKAQTSKLLKALSDFYARR